MAVLSKYTQDLSVQIVFFTFSCKWFLCFYFWAVIWSYIVDLFAALHELASARARTILKLASSVRALLKPYGDTLKADEFENPTLYQQLSLPSVKTLLKSEEFENPTIYQQLSLPSTLICHENGAFRKRSSNRRNLKTPALRLSVDKNNDITIMM